MITKTVLTLHTIMIADQNLLRIPKEDIRPAPAGMKNIAIFFVNAVATSCTFSGAMALRRKAAKSNSIPRMLPGINP